MQLEDCLLDIDVVLAAPMHHTAPEDSWVKARDSEIIPLAVFDLYARASYLSLGAAPPLLADHEKVLFTYFGMVLESLKGSLVEADDELHQFISVQSQRYDPGKFNRGENWDPNAEEQSRRHFKHFLLSLQSALDALADLLALFFTGLVHGLRVGRAQFSSIETWLEQPFQHTSGIVSPQQHFLQQLYDTLRPLIYPDSPEREWLRLMRLFRNKSAHLGNGALRYVVLHDKAGGFYTFLPRQWPYIWERHITCASETGEGSEVAKAAPFQEILIHQDMVTYAKGLRKKVNDVIAGGALVLNATYQQLTDCPLNNMALEQLEKSSETYAFECFPDTESVDAG